MVLSELISMEAAVLNVFEAVSELLLCLLQSLLLVSRHVRGLTDLSLLS